MQSRKHIGQLLWEPYKAHLLNLHEALAQAGYPDIQPTHGNNLFRHVRADGSRITEIAERAQMTKQHIGNLADYLEEHGYVERVVDPTDKRAKLIRLTTKGRELERVAEEILDRLEARLTERLGAGRYVALRGLLEDLDGALEP